ncbi:MAG: hypothetical protein R6X19_02690 [Kiritimatiellia bacterium]
MSGFQDLVVARFSCRAYRNDPVSRSDVEQILEAAELGLGTCWIGWIRPPEIRRIVDWPADITPQALITVGWPVARPARATPRLALDEMVTWR